ncbi:MAG: LLM class flavin-dependent oxidoreductase [Chloroflexi bacterium]|nr:LLM class flavin-dependent oxidoreductase [Chloroflexota bacterium]
MQFGFFMMPAHHPGENPTLCFDRDLDLIEYAESLGYDEYWIGEHHSAGWELIPAPDLFIAAAAQRTKRIRLGTGVVNLPYHHPFDVAERIAFLDHLTHGRLDFGVGPGVLPTDYDLFELDSNDLRPMMDESLEIIMKLFTADGPVTYEGKYWTIRERQLMVKPFQKPHTPLAITSLGGDHGVGLAAKYGAQLLTGTFLRPIEGKVLGEQWMDLERQAAAQGQTVRRDDWRVVYYVYLADTRKQALADIEERVTREQLEYFMPLTAKMSGRSYDPDAKLDIPKMADEKRWIVTDPDGCIEWLKGLERDTGGLGGVLIVSTEWATLENWKRSMELFARYVMPEFKNGGGGAKQAWRKMMDWAAP